MASTSTLKRLFYRQVHYRTIDLNTGSSNVATSSILVIYTGGTLGMVYDEEGKSLIPFDFEQILEKMPELSKFDFRLTVISFNQLIDSANVTPGHWIALASLIEENYTKYNGFVIIHGTDTMAYSASALSFLLEGLNKPVIFTGAQLPIGAVRTDARENLITALEIASMRKEGRPLVTEVAIYFNNLLLRGNRARKVESDQFGAFETRNYPPLAESGIRITFNDQYLKPYEASANLVVHKKMDTRVAILKLFPGIGREIVESILEIPNLKGVVLETYGSGNAPTDTWLVNALKTAVEKDITILNVSQCHGGTVMQGRYETSKQMVQAGVISGADLTTEAAATKLMFLLANSNSTEDLKAKLRKPIRGELTKA